MKEGSFSQYHWEAALGKPESRYKTSQINEGQQMQHKNKIIKQTIYAFKAFTKTT